MDTFFISGPASDPAYLFTRDEPRAIERRAFVEALWHRSRQYVDRNLREDARNHFLQRFWEMYLAVTLLDRGLVLTRHGADGPEFSAEVASDRIWFEAIAPTSGSGADRVPEFPIGELQPVPTSRLLLRFTNALDEKRKRYVAALEKKIIAPEDPYILAINSSAIPWPESDNGIPYFVRAFLAVGPLQITFDTNSHEVVGSSYQYIPEIRKANGAQVSTRLFFEEQGAFCSAVIHSAVDCANHPPEFGGEFRVLRNPNAAHPISEHLFSWCTQFVVRGDEIHRLEPDCSS